VQPSSLTTAAKSSQHPQIVRPIAVAIATVARFCGIAIRQSEALKMVQIYTAFVTLLALLLYFVITMYVGQARTKYGVKAPAVTGNEHFERAYRVQMNTLEQMAFFLPSLWLYAMLLSDKGAAAGGLIWIVGRVLYAVAYTRDPSSRGPGTMISLLAQIGLYLGAAYGVARTFW
jgi:glutathione S-transferase